MKSQSHYVDLSKEQIQKLNVNALRNVASYLAIQLKKEREQNAKLRSELTGLTVSYQNMENAYNNSLAMTNELMAESRDLRKLKQEHRKLNIRHALLNTAHIAVIDKAIDHVIFAEGATDYQSHKNNELHKQNQQLCAELNSLRKQADAAKS